MKKITLIILCLISIIDYTYAFDKLKGGRIGYNQILGVMGEAVVDNIVSPSSGTITWEKNTGSGWTVFNHPGAFSGNIISCDRTTRFRRKVVSGDQIAFSNTITAYTINDADRIFEICDNGETVIISCDQYIKWALPNWNPNNASEDDVMLTSVSMSPYNIAYTNDEYPYRRNWGYRYHFNRNTGSQITGNIKFEGNVWNAGWKKWQGTFFFHQKASLSPVLVADMIICLSDITHYPNGIDKGSRPQPLKYQTAPAQGGYSDNYSMWWQSSPNGINWANVTSPNENTESYQPLALYENTYYRYGVTDGVTVAYSTTSQIKVNNSPVAYLSGGEISGDQIVKQGSGVSRLNNVTSASGGASSGEYIYSWESSLNGNTWTTVSSVNSTTYNPSPISKTTFFRRKVQKNDLTAYSNMVTVELLLDGGEIEYTRVNGRIILQEKKAAEGGIGNYGYYWQIYSEQGGWQEIDGSARNYHIYSSPDFGIIRRVVYSGRREAYSNSISIVPDDDNYIHVTEFHTADQNGPHHTSESVTFYDGLGRAEQLVDIRESPTGENIINFIQYDVMGRNDSVSYIPYPKSSGMVKSQSPVSEQRDFYSTRFPLDQNRTHTYSLKFYDKIPEDVLLSTKKVGKNGHAYPTTHGYRFNDSTDQIKEFRINSNGSLHFSGYYNDGKLHVRSTKKDNYPDSLNVEQYVYSNASGLILAEEDRYGSNDRHLTYYVYDNRERLRFIIPPAQERLITLAGTDNSLATLKERSYYYEFDERDSISVKYIPGMEPVFNIYDVRGRVVLTQNGNLRQNNKWLFTKYDQHDRIIMTGTIVGGTMASHQNAINNQDYFYEATSYDNLFYTNRCYPTAISENDVFAVYYYDRYNFYDNDDYDYDEFFYYDFSPTMGNAMGLKVGSRIRDLKTNKWIGTGIYYDNKHNIIQTVSDLYPDGREYTYSKYDFAGNLLQTRIVQNYWRDRRNVELNKYYQYDSKNRLKSVEYEIEGDTENGRITVANYEYDSFGNIISKRIHNNLETSNYSYNLFGQRTGLESPTFSYKLGFDTPAANGLTGRIDGNIAHYLLGQGTNYTSGYELSYTKKGELISGFYVSPSAGVWKTSQKYSEAGMRYDINGNLLSMTRRNAAGTVLDDIRYSYELAGKANSISSVTVNGTKSPAFQYDHNGNMTYDGYGSYNVVYNELDFPERIYSGGQEIKNIYAGNGTKIAVERGGQTTYYRKDMIFESDGTSTSGQLKHIITPEGMIVYDNGKYTYKYFKQDHLGSNRKVLAAVKNSSGSYSFATEQATDFYPFGMAYQYVNLDKNKYLFSGKELLDDNIGKGMLGLYDFDARNYNPFFGRWFNIDLKGEMDFKASGYIYCGNNPVNYIDPDGKQHFIMDPMGNITRGVGGANDPFDKLFYLNINSNDFIIINDQAFLPQFTNQSRSGNSKGKTTNIDDAFKLFHFGATRSLVEWSIAGYRNKGAANDYWVWTSHNLGSVKSPAIAIDRSPLDLIFAMHSHPNSPYWQGTTDLKNYWGASGYRYINEAGDYWNLKALHDKHYNNGMPIHRSELDQYKWYKSNDGNYNKFPSHYVYEPYVNTLYNYTPVRKFGLIDNGGNYFIRKVNDYRDLYRNLGF